MLGYIVTGTVGVGLAILAWAYLGKDVKRYIRIRSM
jgi:hypothetical protein